MAELKASLPTLFPHPQRDLPFEAVSANPRISPSVKPRRCPQLGIHSRQRRHPVHYAKWVCPIYSKKGLQRRGAAFSAISAREVGVVGEEQLGYLLMEYGWKVRRLAEKESEMRGVADVQAEAFHEPMPLFDDLFFEFFKAEVLAALIYRLRNSPSDRFACLVAEPITASDTVNVSKQGLVGVVDVTVMRDENVRRHLDGAEEYLSVSGIAVLSDFRRQKVATVLLKACDMLSLLWGHKHLALRAYEDDAGARKLYSSAGYNVVSGDPHWMTTWIGRKRRLLMVKKSGPSEYFLLLLISCMQTIFQGKHQLELLRVLIRLLNR